ncbi:hypothetical protein NS226_08540 [Aureimonas ureilytica]|uniref:Uncharacterized protein n=1 Tax=Aureimonas ureilytica TaxID=401562 RepID=A0A175R9V1_9HYPH|nr:hypothetical protein NS226_08540 [Aureimonas ureilytica]
MRPGVEWIGVKPRLDLARGGAVFAQHRFGGLVGGRQERGFRRVEADGPADERRAAGEFRFVGRAPAGLNHGIGIDREEMGVRRQFEGEVQRQTPGERGRASAGLPVHVEKEKRCVAGFEQGQRARQRVVGRTIDHEDDAFARRKLGHQRAQGGVDSLRLVPRGKNGDGPRPIERAAPMKGDTLESLMAPERFQPERLHRLEIGHACQLFGATSLPSWRRQSFSGFASLSASGRSASGRS